MGSAYISKKPVSKIKVDQVMLDIIYKYPCITKCMRDVRRGNLTNQRLLNRFF